MASTDEEAPQADTAWQNHDAAHGNLTGELSIDSTTHQLSRALLLADLSAGELTTGAAAAAVLPPTQRIGKGYLGMT